MTSKHGRSVLYPMREVRKLTGLNDRQIRYYQEKGLLAPRVSPGGHRLFTLADVQLLRRIREMLSRGLSVREVRALLQGDGREPLWPGTIPAVLEERGYEDVKIYFGLSAEEAAVGRGTAHGGFPGRGPGPCP